MNSLSARRQLLIFTEDPNTPHFRCLRQHWNCSGLSVAAWHCSPCHQHIAGVAQNCLGLYRAFWDNPSSRIVRVQNRLWILERGFGSAEGFAVGGLADVSVWELFVNIGVCDWGWVWWWWWSGAQLALCGLCNVLKYTGMCLTGKWNHCKKWPYFYSSFWM